MPRSISDKRLLRNLKARLKGQSLSGICGRVMAGIMEQHLQAYCDERLLRKLEARLKRQSLSGIAARVMAEIMERMNRGSHRGGDLGAAEDK